MKKSYTLLITIILISLFSFLAISILQTKSLRAENLTNQYLYIQAKIYAKIEKNNSIFTIDIFVKAKEFNISLYERVIKE
jgi:hypothetical protein